jgi:hypothetical protein
MQLLLFTLAASFLTVIIELCILILFKYHNKDLILLVVFANIATNLSVNLILSLLYTWVSMEPIFLYFIIGILEMMIVGIEYFLYTQITRQSRRLFLMVVIANLISFILGSLFLIIVF